MEQKRVCDLEMNWRGQLWERLKRALTPGGELCCDILFERSLLAPLPQPKAQLDVTLLQATEFDLDAICRLYSSDSWLYLGETSTDPGARNLYLDRLRRGELCFMAFSGAEIAHVNWICRHWGDAIPGHPVRLLPGEVYTTDAFTLEPFRGLGLHALVLRAMLARAQACGAHHAFTLARSDRTNSHKGLLALGWKECGRIVYFLPRGGRAPWFLWRKGRLDPLFRETTA